MWMSHRVTSLAKHGADPAAEPRQLCVAHRPEQGSFVGGFPVLREGWGGGVMFPMIPEFWVQ